MELKKNNPMRLLFDFFIMLPFFILLFSTFINTFSQATLVFSTLQYCFAMVLSAVSYAVSLRGRRILYIKGDIPADTSFFVAELLLFPLLLFFPSVSPSSSGIFIFLDVGMIVALSVLSVFVGTFGKKDFPLLDSRAVCMLAFSAAMALAVFSIVFFTFSGFFYLAAALSYYAIFEMFGLLVYTAQLFAYKDRIDIKKALLSSV